MLDLEQNSDTSKLQNIDYNLLPNLKLYVLMDVHMPLYFEKYFLIWVCYSLYCIKKIYAQLLAYLIAEDKIT